MEIQKIFTNPYTGERYFSVRLGEKEFGLAQKLSGLVKKAKSGFLEKTADAYSTLQRASIRSAGENVTHALGRVGENVVKNPITSTTMTAGYGLPLVNPALATIPTSPITAVTKKLDNKLLEKFPALEKYGDKIKNFPNTKAGEITKGISEGAWNSIKGFM